MRNQRLFFFLSILFLTALLSHAQTKMGLYPLTQYSVGTNTDIQLRTTATVQTDTLKLPYIEDFSGPGLPIDSMSVDTLPSLQLVYRITHLKMHGLKSEDSIHVYYIATINAAVTNALKGVKYVKVLNKYAFQLFNDAALSIPAEVSNPKVHYLNWRRVGGPGYSTIPDSLGFLNNDGGVFINNDMALNPISIGVASFDGVSYKGIPYSTNTTKGYGDNLTSLPFNLSIYQPQDSLYMSFYWQSKSLGDNPLSSEFLTLEFYNASGAWVQVWKQFGQTETQDTFKIAMIAIKNPSFLHKGFRYRFRSYGVLNGRFNVWNVDYIYINSQRKLVNPYLKDVSIITTNRSALKNYTSVPYKHIRNLPVAAITSETAQAFVQIRDSLYNFSVIERKRIVRDNLKHDRIKYDSLSEFNEQAYIFKQLFTDTIPGGYMTEPYALKEEFYIQALDTIGPIDLSFNNFTAIETYFQDWYSYDDGTPEIAYLSVNPGGTKSAIGYKILKADQLTHIDYCFIKNSGPDLTNSTLILSVWDQDVSTSKPVITPKYTQNITIKYSTDINGFVRYALTTPLALDSGKTYYFGFTQGFNNVLFLGYDKNNHNIDKIFFCNDGNTWQPFTDITDDSGSLMIRPVFFTNEAITSVDTEQIQQDRFTFYPNPAKSELHFTGEPEHISIYDLSGLLLAEKKVEGTEMISTESLSTGLYLLILSKGDYKEVKRLIIQK